MSYSNVFIGVYSAQKSLFKWKGEKKLGVLISFYAEYTPLNVL